jgi:hypothetical protein
VPEELVAVDDDGNRILNLAEVANKLGKPAEVILRTLIAQAAIEQLKLHPFIVEKYGALAVRVLLNQVTSCVLNEADTISKVLRE